METKDFIFFDMAWVMNGEPVEELPKNMFVKVKATQNTTKYNHIEADVANMMEEISGYWGYELKRCRPVMVSRVKPEDLKREIVDINGNPFSLTA